MTTLTHTIVSTAESLEQAATALESSSALIVDCEARDLGSLGGALSLLSIGATDSSNVYLFDALAPCVEPGPGMHPHMRRVLDMLEDENKTKIVWDGRMDCVELFETYSIHMRGVLDLQLVEVATRSSPPRNEEEGKRLNRFLRFFPPRVVFRNRHWFNEVYILMGLGTAVRVFELEDELKKDKTVTKLHHENGSEAWMVRPLSDQLLAYAARDVHSIRALYCYFVSTGILPSERKGTFVEQSARYMNIYRSLGRIDDKDPYLKGPFMPLDVLVAPTGGLIKCAGCQRELSKRHFSQEKNGLKSVLCRVCAIVDLKAEWKEKRELQKQGEKTFRQANAMAEVVMI